jgi:large subunit ribosomal protein L3
MKKAIIGKKLGMTQLFAADGSFVPVTVIEAGPCVVTQVKTEDRDGYKAIQFGFMDVPERKLSKPEVGHLKKSKSAPKKVLKEFKFENAEQFELGKTVKCDIFAAGDVVDVSGVTRGRGFTGVIQRHNQSRLKMTHGTGPVHRSLGSTGANSTPSRVLPGKKMAGQYGNENVTIQNLEIVKVDTNRNVLLVKGSVPGPKGGLLTVRQAVKV